MNVFFFGFTNAIGEDALSPVLAKIIHVNFDFNFQFLVCNEKRLMF